MNIQHAILGLLRKQSMTGYDLKKAMQKSPIIYWSGNNNQIYNALFELENEGLVVSRIFHCADSPTKKLYSLTEDGKKELRRLSFELPELPEIRKSFLMQLIFAGELNKTELESLLQQYYREIQGAAFAVKEDNLYDNMTPFEQAIYTLSIDNVRESYKSELAWIDKVRAVALPLASTENKEEKIEVIEMEFKSITKNENGYIEITSGIIRDERDGITLISACAEYDTNKIMLPSACIGEDFLQLSTCVAGHVMQKLTNYNVKAAAILESERIRGKFKDFVIEANRKGLFRVFEDREQAERWLLEE